MKTAPLLRAAVLVAALALSGCAGAEETTTPASGSALTGEITVYAAASLSGAFDQLAADFEAANPGIDVLPITYDGSSVLATQLIEGASADVFASADERSMAKVTDAGLADDAAAFATNALEIAVAPGNPHSIDGLESLADGASATPLTIVRCAAEVPCGNAAMTLIEQAALTITPASEEQNVTAVLSKVKAGEADAGIVYRTDIAAADGDVEGIEIANADDAVNVYPLTALGEAANPDAAAAFVEFVLSPAGQQVLAEFGFGAPRHGAP